MTSDNARRVRSEGHKAEAEFAELIGGTVYSSGRKKDVIDKKGDIHSVKSGQKKWQIFLYGAKRFKADLHFYGAEFFLRCIESFPESRADYLANKITYKTFLQKAMKELKDFLSQTNGKKLFLQKAFLNNSEVDYLTIKDGEIFRVFDGLEAVEIIDASTAVFNSKALQTGQYDGQKVTFKLMSDDFTIGEIEMRNDSDIHYREVKFWMDKVKTLDLLKTKIKKEKLKYHKVIAHGKAVDKFKIL